MRLGDFEALVANSREGNWRKPLLLEVDDPMAFPASEMMVLVGARIEAGCPAGVVYLLNDPQLNQHTEPPVNCGSGNAGNSLLDGIEYLLGRRVVPAIGDLFQNRPTLYRERETPVAAQTFKLGQSFATFMRRSFHVAWDYIADAIK